MGFVQKLPVEKWRRIVFPHNVIDDDVRQTRGHPYLTRANKNY